VFELDFLGRGRVNPSVPLAGPACSRWDWLGLSSRSCVIESCCLVLHSEFTSACLQPYIWANAALSSYSIVRSFGVTWSLSYRSPPGWCHSNYLCRSHKPIFGWTSILQLKTATRASPPAYLWLPVKGNELLLWLSGILQTGLDEPGNPPVRKRHCLVPMLVPCLRHECLISGKRQPAFRRRMPYFRQRCLFEARMP
jgi:hypothetical protein